MSTNPTKTVFRSGIAPGITRYIEDAIASDPETMHRILTGGGDDRTRDERLASFKMWANIYLVASWMEANNIDGFVDDYFIDLVKKDLDPATGFTADGLRGHLLSSHDMEEHLVDGGVEARPKFSALEVLAAYHDDEHATGNADHRHQERDE